MAGRYSYSPSYGRTSARRIGVPDDQYGNPKHTDSPVNSGNLTANHDWSGFEDAFSPRSGGIQMVAPAHAGATPAAAPGAAVAPAAPAAVPQVATIPGQQNTNRIGPNLFAGPTGVSAVADSFSGPREVAVSPDAHVAARLLTGVDPYSVSPAQRTANLQRAVGQTPPTPIQTVGEPSYDGAPQVTPIDPKYQAPGGPQIGTTRYVTPVAPITVHPPIAASPAPASNDPYAAGITPPSAPVAGIPFHPTSFSPGVASAPSPDAYQPRPAPGVVPSAGAALPAAPVAVQPPPVITSPTPPQATPGPAPTPTPKKPDDEP